MATEFEGNVYDDTHGGPFDRGSADSYYGRGIDPHYYPQGTYNGDRVEKGDMTVEELEDYLAGYDYNEMLGAKKEW